MDVEELYGPIEEEIEVATLYNYHETPENRSWASAIPPKQGLYNPEFEKDACGVGFAAYVVTNAYNHARKLTKRCSHIKGKVSHKIISDGKKKKPFQSLRNRLNADRSWGCSAKFAM